MSQVSLPSFRCSCFSPHKKAIVVTRDTGVIEESRFTTDNMFCDVGGLLTATTASVSYLACSSFDLA